MKNNYLDCRFLGGRWLGVRECKKTIIKVIGSRGDYIGDMPGTICIITNIPTIKECLSFEPNFFGIVKETLKKVEIKDMSYLCR